MLIDVQIARRLNLQIDPAVAGEQLEHVIEKADAGRNLVAAAALDREARADLRFFRIAFDKRGSHASSTGSI